MCGGLSPQVVQPVHHPTVQLVQLVQCHNITTRLCHLLVMLVLVTRLPRCEDEQTSISLFVCHNFVSVHQSLRKHCHRDVREMWPKLWGVYQWWGAWMPELQSGSHLFAERRTLPPLMPSGILSRSGAQDMWALPCELPNLLRFVVASVTYSQ